MKKLLGILSVIITVLFLSCSDDSGTNNNGGVEIDNSDLIPLAKGNKLTYEADYNGEKLQFYQECEGAVVKKFTLNTVTYETSEIYKMQVYSTHPEKTLRFQPHYVLYRDDKIYFLYEYTGTNGTMIFPMSHFYNKPEEKEYHVSEACMETDYQWIDEVEAGGVKYKGCWKIGWKKADCAASEFIYMKPGIGLIKYECTDESSEQVSYELTEYEVN